MPKIEEAQSILKTLGLPPAQQNEMSALTLLALCDLKPNDSWKQAHRHSVTITKDIMAFVVREYGKQYAPNTRETFRRQVLHQFVQAGIADYNPDAPQLPTNSPRAHYAISEAAIVAVRTYGAKGWKSAVNKFIAQQGSLLDVYQKNRAAKLVPVRLPDGTTLKLSPGAHNQLQADVIENFAPRYAPGARLLYLGDTAKKNLHVDSTRLAKLGVPLSEHAKLPDVVLYDQKRNWLFLIEAVTSHGPMTPKRVVELEAMFAVSNAGRVYVSAFPDLAEFRKHLKQIAWETEVWIAEIPKHLIHFNGDRFLGPR
ncbi:MAG: BsuBI/PstI family type II restriction endonuclease [Acidobacteriota bacterium]|nr:BsuBI/PstI family type II restriction endonuclease [Acidobacteriota bacterium]